MPGVTDLTSKNWENNMDAPSKKLIWKTKKKVRVEMAPVDHTLTQQQQQQQYLTLKDHTFVPRYLH